MIRKSVPAYAAALLASAASAATYDFPPPGNDLIGAEYYVRAKHEDTLIDLARRHGLGYDELRLANPGVDSWLPGEGTSVLIPARHLLPDGAREGIVINLAELRLYYFPPAPKPEKNSKKKIRKPNPRQVITYPISVGREGLATPLTTTKVLEKLKNPAWYPGDDIRKEHAADGDVLPRVVPPGPDNPLGPLALKLGLPGVFIHGTNKPYSIGMPATHGCIRLYPEDIEALMPRVPRGTKVRIVNQIWKTGWKNSVLYFEVSAPPSKSAGQDWQALEHALNAAVKQRPGYDIDWTGAEAALLQPRGLPQPVWRQSLSDPSG